MHILVVDDKTTILDSICSLLEKAGYTVETAINGLNAYEKAQHQVFDLFIVDHLMPIMNGLQLGKNLLNNEATAQIPIIFMTTQNVDEILAMEEASDFLTVIDKPINETSLLDIIRGLNSKNSRCYSL